MSPTDTADLQDSLKDLFAQYGYERVLAAVRRLEQEIEDERARTAADDAYDRAKARGWPD